MGLDISSKKVRVYKTETANGYDRYSIGIGKQNQSGAWENAYLEAVFKKGISVENKTDIVVNKGFITFDINKKTNQPVWKAFITEFAKCGDGFVQADDGELPFK